MTETTTYTLTEPEMRALGALQALDAAWGKHGHRVRPVAETARMGEQRTRQALRGLQEHRLAMVWGGPWGRVLWSCTPLGKASSAGTPPPV